MSNWFSIEDNWKEFETKVIHPDAGEEQRKCMKMAFYFGASVIMVICERLGEKDVSKEEGLKVLDSLKKEIIGYMLDGKEERHEP